VRNEPVWTVGRAEEEALEVMEVPINWPVL
jgi:hypothetical protein